MNYQRVKPGWRFTYGGINLTDVPDAIGPTKYASGLNVRGYAKLGIRSRAGYNSIFSTGAGNPVTDVRGYSTLGTDNLPRWLVRDNQNGIYLDTATLLVTLPGPNQGGVSFVPFRPSNSPQSWMYVSSAGAYKKISAPVANVATVQKVGLPEPQLEVEFAPLTLQVTKFTGLAAAWTNGGTAGSPSDGTRSSDTISAVFADPANTNRKSCQVATTVQYQIGEVTSQGVIQDVLPPIPSGLTIQAIYYQSGSSGACTIVPSQLPVGAEAPGITPSGFLRRGALVELDATEVVLVLDVTEGPNGMVCFDTSTVGSYSATQAIAGIPAIVIDGASAAAVTAANITSTVTAGVGTLSQALASSPFGEQLASSGIFPQEDDYIHISVLISNPAQIEELKISFNVDASDTSYEENAYYFSVNPSALAPVVTGKSTQFSGIQTGTEQQTVLQGAASQALQDQQLLASGVQSAELQAQLDNIQNQIQQSLVGETAIGSSQWTEILFPISALTRVGNDQTRTLVNCNGVQVYVNVQEVTNVWQSLTFLPLGYEIIDPSGHIQEVTTAGISGTTQPTFNDSGGTTSDGSVTWTDLGTSANSITMAISSLWVGGGGQPDVGDTGADYRYRVVPRCSVTGSTGNASPDPRYGVRPRRQNVILKTSSLSTVDAQQDYWDIYRYGGSITSFRFLGTVPTGTDWTDQYFDDAAAAGSPLQADNFEPWPSVDIPFSQASNITVYGTWVTLTSMSLVPGTIGSWLPGTLITLGGIQTYTLRSRPTKLSSTSYLFELIECAGAPTPGSFLVQEPLVAANPNQSVWGPDSLGVFFGVGDQYRPGTISWAKQNNPDSVPAVNNKDICPPNEPLLGGAIRTGVSIVGSTKRWWALYPNFNTPGAYDPIEIPVGKPLITSWGHVTDGSRIFYWSKDGIYATDGSAAQSLTYDDLYFLFPHDNVNQGINIVRNGVTYYAPDYSRANTFRLGLQSGYLYATYQDTTGTYRVLACCVATGAWSQDQYHDAVSVAWGWDGQPGTLGAEANALYASLVMGTVNGLLVQSQDGISDSGGAQSIPIVLATFEWDADDLRAASDYGDLYLDSRPYCQITATPQVQGAAIPGVSPTVIPVSTARSFLPISLGGITSQKFVGLLLTWNETFPNGLPTILHAWDVTALPRPETTKDRFGDWIGSYVS